ncbi:hypothetical protein NIES2111_61500 (plasmid) [Nostoc sp. NIES-2111]|nr:hypothetical protein NIES2111_61500 [Nostoc sp. NIES-2111]
MIATQLIPGDRKITSTQVMEIAASSPVGRAVYYGGVNEWFPMQLLQNFSGYDRDNKKFLDKPKTNDSSQTADLDATETSQSQSQRVLALLERTTASSLDEFIHNELKLEGTQAHLVRVGIEKLLKDSPLRYKFDG